MKLRNLFALAAITMLTGCNDFFATGRCRYEGFTFGEVGRTGCTCEEAKASVTAYCKSLNQQATVVEASDGCTKVPGSCL